MKTKKMRFLVLTGVITIFGISCASTHVANNPAPAVTVDRELASGKCDGEEFTTRIRKRGCFLSNNDERRIKQNSEYCKQLASKFQIVTMRDSGDVVVLDTTNCTRTKFEVDSSGINQLKIIQDYAYMTSNDGQLYIYSSHSKKFFELRSDNGNSYSKKYHSNVTDLEGTVGGTDVYSIHANGNRQHWDSEKINSMSANRRRELRFWNFASTGSVYND